MANSPATVDTPGSGRGDVNHRAPAVSERRLKPAATTAIRADDRVICVVAGEEIPNEHGTALFIYQNTEGRVSKVEGGIASVRFDRWERDARVPVSHLKRFMRRIEEKGPGE